MALEKAANYMRIIFPAKELEQELGLALSVREWAEALALELESEKEY